MGALIATHVFNRYAGIISGRGGGGFLGGGRPPPPPHPRLYNYEIALLGFLLIYPGVRTSAQDTTVRKYNSDNNNIIVTPTFKWNWGTRLF